MEPHDVDIVTDAAGASAIERLFPEYVEGRVAFDASSADGIRSHRGSLRIGGVRVEIIGGAEFRREDGTWEAPEDVGVHRADASFEGSSIPVIALDRELHVYRRQGRLETAEQIQRVLDSRTPRSTDQSP